MNFFVFPIFIAFLLLSFQANSQSRPDKIDKLEKEAIRLLKSMPDIEKGYKLVQQLDEYAEATNDEQSKINALLLFARYYDQKGDYRNSIKHSLLIVDKISKFPELDYIKSLNDFTNLLNRFGFYREALKYERLLLHFENKEKATSKSYAISNLAYTFTMLGIKDSAIHYRMIQFKNAMESKNLYQELAAYNNLGVTYRDLNETEAASNYFFKADSLFQLYNTRNNKDSTLHAFARGNWGGVLFELGNAQKGEELLMYDINFNLTRGEKYGGINGIIDLAKHLIRIKSYD